MCNIYVAVSYVRGPDSHFLRSRANSGSPSCAVTSVCSFMCGDLSKHIFKKAPSVSPSSGSGYCVKGGSQWGPSIFWEAGDNSPILSASSNVNMTESANGVSARDPLSDFMRCMVVLLPASSASLAFTLDTRVTWVVLSRASSEPLPRGVPSGSFSHSRFLCVSFGFSSGLTGCLV